MMYYLFTFNIFKECEEVKNGNQVRKYEEERIRIVLREIEKKSLSWFMILVD